MIESQNPEIDVQELMARVRAEVDKRKGLPVSPPVRPLPPSGSTPTASVSPVRPLGANVAVALDRARQKNHVSPRIPAVVHPFFRNQGGFNLQLLRAIELQVQQIEALQSELANLQQASRAEVASLQAALAKLQQANRADVTGLQAMLANLQQASRTEVADLRGTLTTLQEANRAEVAGLRTALANLEQAGRAEVADLRGALADSHNQIKALQAGTREQVEGLRTALNEQQTQNLSAQQQVRALEKQLADLSDRLFPRTPSPEWDAIYLAFENQFRGTRADIKERQRVYLPYLAKAAVGTAAKPVLDIGCGRGEWLELLRESGHTARGVDLNESMVATCRKLGLEVEQSDAIAYLKLLPDASLGAITGFHIIEHVPFPVLMILMMETCRVLQPGGLAVFESPNCKNLVVGASNFYSDPTHRNPVFPDTAKFILEQVGFSSADILYLMPVPESPFDHEAPESALLHNWFFGPRDFAVICRK